MKHGRAGAEETATDAHLRGDSTKKALDPRDDGAYLVAKAHELNHTNMYIFDVRWTPSLRGPETHSLGATPFRGLAPYPSEYAL